VDLQIVFAVKTTVRIQIKLDHTRFQLTKTVIVIVDDVDKCLVLQSGVVSGP